MSDIVLLTPSPVYYTGSQTHPIWNSVEISRYGALDLAVGILGWTGTATGTLSLRAVTGFDTDQDDASWFPVFGTTPVPPNIPDISLPFPSTPYWFKATLRSGGVAGGNTSPLGRYLRWQVQN